MMHTQERRPLAPSIFLVQNAERHGNFTSISSHN